MLPRENCTGKMECANRRSQVGNDDCKERHAGCDLEQMRQTARGRGEREERIGENERQKRNKAKNTSRKPVPTTCSRLQSMHKKRAIVIGSKEVRKSENLWGMNRRASYRSWDSQSRGLRGAPLVQGDMAPAKFETSDSRSGLG